LAHQKLNRIRILPKYYFVVSGAALSPVSPLNAFDEALKAAGIYNLNLVKVSSILPKEVTYLKLSEEEAATFFEEGEVVFTVQACAIGVGEEYLSAGLMWGEGLDVNGFVMEHELSLPSSKPEPTMEDLRENMIEMLESKFEVGVRIRGIGIKEQKIKTVEIFVPRGMYGCALASLVLC